MFKILGKFFKKTIHECRQHDTKHFPNILANEYCHSCETNICYMCGNDHIQNQHPVRVSQYSISDMNLNDTSTLQGRELINFQVLKNFNQGQLTYLDINKLKCICGKPANEQTAICAACGSATCSKECHQELIKQEKCKFHHNFTENHQNTSLRSILIKNAYILFDKGYTQGSVFSRTSQHFISAFLTSQRNGIYLQRGYRQYGNPDILTLNAMETVKEAYLDQEIHLMRVCNCKCMHCRNLGYHPIHICQQYCKEKNAYIIRSFAQENPIESEQQCECQCIFCKSGHTIHTHKKIDCCTHCEFKKQIDF